MRERSVAGRVWRTCLRPLLSRPISSCQMMAVSVPQPEIESMSRRTASAFATHAADLFLCRPRRVSSTAAAFMGSRIAVIESRHTVPIWL